MKQPTPGAIELLEADHLATHARFQAYRDLVRQRAPATERRALAEEICMELTIHARLEEELFYPAVRAALRDDALVDQVEDQHGNQRELVAQILSTGADDPLYDARVVALAEYAQRHVRTEREQVFNRVAAARIDLHSLGRAIATRREELHTVADALREDTLASASV